VTGQTNPPGIGQAADAGTAPATESLPSAATRATDGDVALWSAVSEQAQEWASIPLVQRFASQLPRNADRLNQGVPALLQEWAAMGAGTWVHGRPLLLAPYVPLFDGMPGRGAADVPEREMAAFFEAASRVYAAHRGTVAWLRSRLPGYPQLPAPQLAPGTPWTTREYTWRMVWLRAELGAQLQFASQPSSAVAEALGIGPKVAATLETMARAVGSALEQHPVLLRLAEASAVLGPVDHAALRAARRDLRGSLTEGQVDAHEPRAALPRAQFRENITQARIARLDGPARVFAEAFASADDLIARAGSDIFGQLALFGRPRLASFTGSVALHAAQADEATSRAWPPVTITGDLQVSDRDDFPNAGILLRVEGGLIEDVLQVVSMTFSMANASEEPRFGVTAEILPGASVAWAGTPYGS
jgi:hypothetical protein